MLRESTQGIGRHAANFVTSTPYRSTLATATLPVGPQRFLSLPVVFTPAQEATEGCNVRAARHSHPVGDDLDVRGSAAPRVHRPGPDQGQDPHQRGPRD